MITEAFEPTDDKRQALNRLYGIAVQYYQDKESFGVLAMYERNAIELFGATIGETEAELKKAKEFVRGS